MNVFTSNIYELIAPQKQAKSEALLQDAWWRGGHFDVVFMEGQGRVPIAGQRLKPCLQR